MINDWATFLFQFAIFLIASWAVNPMVWDTYNSFNYSTFSSSVTYATKTLSLPDFIVMFESPPNLLKPTINAIVLKRAVEFFPLYSVVVIFPLAHLSSVFFSVKM